MTLLNKKAKRLAAKKAQEESVKTPKVINAKPEPKAGVESPVKKKKKTIHIDGGGTPEPKTDPKDKAKKLDDKTATAVVKAITEQKDLKYTYPADADTLDKRKKFRADVRRKIASMEKEVSKLEASTLKEDKILLEKKAKDFDKYLAQVLAPKVTT